MTTEQPRSDPDQDRFAPLTPSARLAFNNAMVEANSRGHEFILPEHLLLGLVGMKKWAAWPILSGLGIGEALSTATMESRQVEVAAVTVSRPAPGTRAAVLEYLPTRLAPQSRRVLELAGEEAARMGSDTIDTAHLLIGILREGSVDNTQFGRLINSAMLDDVRNLAAQTRGQGQEEWISTRNPNAPASPTPRIRMVEFPLDVSTLDLFDLLVEAGFAQSRADVLKMFIG
ncbi:MAG TPA: Clp protease N-terminal domain-containing protein, partial [Ktedonobacterales bacterium]|nr:Clp protease N-terminal domain-containing protein [Ktedonobacterales bacterium]